MSMEYSSYRVVGNADNTDLSPLGGKGLVIGYVDEVNRLGAEEIPGFIPTRHELIQLIKYWVSMDLEDRWFYFCYGQTGSTEMRRGPFARRRVERIARLLGEDKVSRAVDEVHDEYRKQE